MPRTCTICAHDHCTEINHALVNGEPYRTIAEEWRSIGVVLLDALPSFPEARVAAAAAFAGPVVS